MRTAEAANGKWFGILTHFGVDKSFLRNVHGPCPLCGGKDRFRYDDKNGDGTYYCNGCGAGDGFKLLQNYTNLNFKELAKKVDSIVGNIEVKTVQSNNKNPLPRLKYISSKIQYRTVDDPVEKYLENRNLPKSNYLYLLPKDDYWYDGKKLGTYPAMVARVLSPEGKPLTFHLTYLTKDGHKAPVPKPKKIQTPIADMAGGAIRLSDPRGDHIGIAEGIETALAVKWLYKTDCWAAYSSDMLEKFQPPKGIRSVTIYGDLDESFTGQASAFFLAKKLKRKGYAVNVVFPKKTGTDFADMLQGDKND